MVKPRYYPSIELHKSSDIFTIGQLFFSNFTKLTIDTDPKYRIPYGLV